jgi:probable HAF family extracellular repeat protein
MHVVMSVLRMAPVAARARSLASLGAAIGFGLVGAGASAQDLECITPPVGGPEQSEMCNLGVLEQGDRSTAYGANGIGTAVVGEARTGSSSNSTRAFIWTLTGGMVNLGVLEGGRISGARGISGDGTVVVGVSETADHTYGFRWTAAGGMVDLGSLLPGGQAGFTIAQGTNADGSVVVGRTSSPTPNITTIAFRWTAATGMVSLGELPGGGSSIAYAVSADGSVIVGSGETQGTDIAFRWTEDTGFDFLNAAESSGFRADPELRTFARGVNADGSVIVGYGEILVLEPGGETPRIRDRAFRWTEATGMVSLGILEDVGSSEAAGVSADGTVVVGRSATSNGDRAFRWTEETGMVSLGTLAGTDRSRARGVSADGRVVVGESGRSSGMRAFIWRGVMEDFENLITSFPVLGNDTAVASAEQQFALGQMMGQSAMAAAGQTVLAARAAVQRTGRNPTTVGGRTTSLAALSLGRGISDSLTLGASLSVNGSSLKNNAFNMDTGFGAAVWGQYSAGGAARTGLQFSGALAYMRNTGEVARGRLLTDVVLAQGSAAVETRAVQASFGYGLVQGDWLVTPSLGLAHFATQRAAYTETGAAFNASYDAMRTNRTVATLSMTGEVALTAQGRVTIGVGLDHEITPERPRLTGTSDIPGLANFDIASTFTQNRTRPFATLGYAHDFGNGATISGDMRLGRATYGTTPALGLGLTYGLQF